MAKNLQHTDLDHSFKSHSIKKLLDASSALDAVASAYFIVDDSFQIVYCNKACLQNIEANSSDVEIKIKPGDLFKCLNSYHKNGCGQTAKCKGCDLRKCIIQAFETNDTVTKEIILTHANNKMIAFNITATPFTLNQTKFVSISSIDITDLKKKQLTDSVFFHDLINLSGSLSGYLEVINDFEPIDAASHIPQIRNIADQILDEIIAHREIARAEENRLDPDCSTIEIEEFLSDLILKINFHPSSKSRNIRFEKLPSPFSFYSDRRLLDRILLNMLKNAVEFISKGETVTLKVDKDEKQIIFSVHNPGYIPQEIQERIFQYAYSTKGIGRGLGTYSIRLLGENILQGKVWFESTPTQGTTFFLRIPIFLTEPE